MKYACTLTIKDPTGRINAALTTEMRSQERSSMALRRAGKSLTISIAAADAIALKASTHTIIQLLEVDERMEQVRHGR